jgi:RNA polymerase sigma-70 factor (ECF subfamily)
MQPADHTRAQQRLNWLTEIYRAHAAELQRYILSKVGERALAEDLTSTVFLKALRWLREDQSSENVRGWLYATARTTLIDHWQAQSQHEAFSLSELEMRFAFPLEDAAQAREQAASRVQRLLSLLPERERNVLTLRYLQGYSAAEIAEALGTNAGHIRVLQLRALRHAARLERQERTGLPMQGAPEGAFETCIRQLSPQSRRVLDLALEESITLNHNFIGTEHLLWGLVREGSLSAFFTPLDIIPERIHAGITFIFARQEQQGMISALQMPPAEVGALERLTPRARQMILLAGEEMKSQGEQSIRPEHLLLGLMNEGQGIGAGLLRSLGVALLQVRGALSLARVEQFCSFCGHSGLQVQRFFPAEMGITSTDLPPALICDRCVERFHAMLHPA